MEGVMRRGLLKAVILAAALSLSLALSIGLGRGASAYPIMPFPREKTPVEVLLNVISLSIPSIIISSLLASAIKYAKALILRGLIILGAFTAILMARGTLELHGGLSSILLLWLLMCIVVLSTLAVVVSPPEGVMAFLYLIYGSILGAFIGVNSPTSSILLLLAAFSVYDIFFSRWVRSEGEGREGLRIAIPLEGVEVGIGDIIFYSLVASHTVRYFGVLMALQASTLMMVGCTLNLLIAYRLGSIPGLPIPLALGVLPILTTQFTGLGG